MPEDTLRLGIDATPAERGARRFNRALGGVSARVQKVRAQTQGAFAAMGQSIMAGAGAFGGLRRAVVGTNLNQFSRSAAGLTGNMRGLENAFSASFQAASLFRVAIGAITLGTLVSSIFDATVQLERFVTTMQVASGSVIEAGEAMRFTQGLALRLGQDLGVVQQEFSQFAVAAEISGLSGQQARDIFSSVSTAMTVMGRSAQDSRLAFLALQQMISKGTVQTEELRRQLGERMPGAVQLMAQAVGVTTAELGKMLKRGEVISKEVLPEFARVVEERFGRFLPQAFERADVQLGRVVSSFQILRQVIGNAGFMDVLADSFERLADILQSPEMLEAADRLGRGLADAADLATRAVIFLADNFGTLVTVMKGFLVLGAVKIVQNLATSLLTLPGIVGGVSGDFRTLTRSLTLMNTQSALSAVTLANTAGATTRLGKAAFSARAGVVALGAAFRLALGPVGLAISAAVVAFDLLIDRQDTATDRLESAEDAASRLGDSIEEVNAAIARMSEPQLQRVGEQIEQGIESAGRGLADARATAVADIQSAIFESQMQQGAAGGFGAELRIPDEVFQSARKATEAFKSGAIGVEEFRSRLNEIEMPTDAARDFVMSLKAMTDRIVDLATAQRDLRETQQDVFTARFANQIDPAAAVVEKLDNVLGTLDDSLLAAGSASEKLNEEIREENLSGYELALKKIQEEFQPVIKSLDQSIDNLEQFNDLVSSEKLDEARQLRAQLTEQMEKLARLRAKETDAEKDARKEFEKNEKAARALLDSLFPLDEATRELSEGMTLLDFAVENSIISEERLAEARRLLVRETEEVLDPTRAYIRELEDEADVLQRALRFQERIPGLTRDQAIALSEAIPLTKEMTDAEIRRAQAAQETIDAIRNPPPATGFDAFIEDVGTLQEGLENVKQRGVEELSESLAQFATTGKASIADLANTMLLEFNRVLSSQIVSQLLQTLQLGSAPAGQGGGFASLLGPLGSFATGLFDGGGGAAGAVTGGGEGAFFIPPTLREGGVSSDPNAPRHGPVPASAFSRAPHFRFGGLTSDEIPSILHPDEAVVPLSGGRAIPVDVRNGNQGQAVNVNNTFVFPPGSDVESFRRSEGQISNEFNASIRRASRRNG